MTPEQFIAKWKPVTLTERSASQQHFIDLCQLIGEPTPAEADPTGEWYTFEKGATKASGGNGWADVWRRGTFGWEYKGKGKDLNAAYLQLKLYADALENPPLLVTSDIQQVVIHTNFTNSVKQVHTIQLEDLADPKKLEMLRWVFAEPEKLRPGITRAMVTTAAAEQFSEMAHRLQAKGHPPHRVAHFLNRLIFAMFAEDAGLLPNNVFNRMITAAVDHPESFENYAKQLFASMATGGTVAFEKIEWFNGGLFDDDSTLPLEKAEIDLLLKCADLDWKSIDPSIFGTLFERGLDPEKRSQLGAHYTDPETIMKIVAPVVLDPWRSAWSREKETLEKLISRAKGKPSDAAMKRYVSFLERLHQYRVLDPSCGSGNFIYLALRALKDFEKHVILEAELLGLPRQFPRVGPESVLGLEVNPYAAELARVTIWIGEIQWMLENGFGIARNPILRPLNQIQCRDAILNDDGTEPAWPKADAIVGNPPFLGNKKMLAEIGEQYTTRLRRLYEGRVSGSADLCCYWFEKARAALVGVPGGQCGLVATQSIRAGGNRMSLERVVKDLRIHNAWSDIPWVNEGAAVRVSLICFGHGTPERGVFLDGQPVAGIRADLSAQASANDTLDLTAIRPLEENASIAFQGTSKVGAFELAGDEARKMLLLPNPTLKPNTDVVKPWANGQDIARRWSDGWIIDFGTVMDEAEAAGYEAPFERISQLVKPERATQRRDAYRIYWWRHAEARPGMRRALEPLKRFIVTPRVAKHRFFVWLPQPVLPDTRLYAIARDDDVTFGILNSSIHTVWSLANASMHGVGNDPTYNAKSCFETFAFPEGLTPKVAPEHYESDPRAQKISKAARQLNELRENWLNPPNLVDRMPEVVAGLPDRLVPKDAAAEAELKKRTLTNLYNANPAWLQNAQRELDAAVAAAYGWKWPLPEDEVLRLLFALNQHRAGAVVTSEPVPPAPKKASKASEDLDDEFLREVGEA